MVAVTSYEYILFNIEFIFGAEGFILNRCRNYLLAPRRTGALIVSELVSVSSSPVIRVQEPVSRKPRKVFEPVKPFLDHLFLKTEKCIHLKLLA